MSQLLISRLIISLLLIIVFSYAMKMTWTKNVRVTNLFKNISASLIGHFQSTEETSVDNRADIEITPRKVLKIMNQGTVRLRNVRAYITKYIFSEKSLVDDEWSIESINKVGGPLTIAKDIEGGKTAEFDLTKNRFLEFFKDPGRGENLPMLTYYALRIIYDAGGKEVVHYFVTSAVKNFPSFVDNFENTAFSGSPKTIEFFRSVKDKVIQHQKSLYG